MNNKYDKFSIKLCFNIKKTLKNQQAQPYFYAGFLVYAKFIFKRADCWYYLLGFIPKLES